jgi:O-antigen/teichoic acid export membrane protein
MNGSVNTVLALQSDTKEQPSRSELVRASIRSVLLAIALAQAAAAIMYVLAARTLGPETYGNAAVLLGIAVAVAGILDLGSNSHALREIATGRMTHAEARGRALSKAALTGGICLFALLLTDIITAAVHALAYSAAALSALMQFSQSLQNELRAESRAGVAAGALLLDRVSALLIVAFMVVFFPQVGQVSLWVALIIGCILGAGYAALKLRLECGIRASPRNPYRGGMAFGPTAVASGVQPLDTSVIGMSSSSDAAAQYAVVSRWTAPFTLIPLAISQIHGADLAKARTDRQALNVIRKTWKPLVANWCLSVIVAFMAPDLVQIILGPGYEGAGSVLSLLMLSTIPMSISSCLTVFLQSRGKERMVATIMTIVVVTQFAALPGVSYLWGANGAACTMLATQTVLGGVLMMSTFRMARSSSAVLVQPK